METATQKIEQKEVKLSDIILSKTNPRKVFSPEADDEMLTSIREKGVLQPVLLRPKGEKYELVCGERRYKASLSVRTAIKSRDTIPAVIRELSDDETLEIQIVENLQRRDIHPMEEATAFKQIIDARRFTVHEIAGRVGKSPRYVAERLKLIRLVPDFQQAFYNNRLNLTCALQVAVLSPQAQEDLYKDEADRTGEISISGWSLRKYTGELNKAPFDQADDKLNPKMGACSNCQFNTGANSLFPEEAVAPKCTYLKCYEEKTDIHFERELKNAMSEPGVELISREYNMGKAARDMRNKGLKVHGYNEYQIEAEPDPPVSWEDYKDDSLDMHDDDEVACRKAYDEEISDYSRLKAEYQKKIDSGKYIRAYVIEGEGAGKYAYIYFKKNPAGSSSNVSAGLTSAGVKEKMKEGTITSSDIEGEIKRLQESEKRKRELDQEKLTVKLYEFLSAQKTYVTDKALDNAELIALLIVLAEKCGYGAGARIYKPLGLSFSASSNHTNLYKGLAGLKKPNALVGVFNRIVKGVLVTELNSQAVAPEKSGKAAALHALVNRFWPKDAQKMATQVDLDAKDRQDRLNTRISELRGKQKQMKEGKPGKKAVNKNAKRVAA